jgi:hypothetical protein
MNAIGTIMLTTSTLLILSTILVYRRMLRRQGSTGAELG